MFGIFIIAFYSLLIFAILPLWLEARKGYRNALRATGFKSYYEAINKPIANSTKAFATLIHELQGLGDNARIPEKVLKNVNESVLLIRRDIEGKPNEAEELARALGRQLGPVDGEIVEAMELRLQDAGDIAVDKVGELKLILSEPAIYCSGSLLVKYYGPHTGGLLFMTEQFVKELQLAPIGPLGTQWKRLQHLVLAGTDE